MEKASAKQRQWKPRHVIMMVALGVVAIVLAPVAVGAATGQIVNIADGTNAANVAKVNEVGRLLTSTSGAVSVTNMPAAAEPFQQTISVGVTSANSSGSANFAVPAGKRLQIESVSGRGYTTDMTELRLSTGTDAVYPDFHNGKGGGNWVAPPQPVLLHVNAGGSLTVKVSHPAGSCGSCSSYNYITVSGYLFPA